MLHYMPEIAYHDRKALLSVDIHPSTTRGNYRIATASVQNEVRIWEFKYEVIDTEGPPPIVVNFVANLEGHSAAINQVKFTQNPEYNLLASGDVYGRISIWQLSDQPCATPPLEDFPPNKENWIRIKVINHESDVTALCWSPCGKYLASVSNDDSLQVHEAQTGKRQFIVSYLRHFPNGITYDPLGKYLLTMSTDRKMDLLCARKGTRLRSFGTCELPEICNNDILIQNKIYKLFHDDQVGTFTRSCSFSPCGQLVVAPVGRLEAGTKDVYCTYVFKRWELETDRPAAILPCPERPPFCIRFCPVIFSLVKESNVNYTGLPYRLIWLAATRGTIIIYDSQHPCALAIVDKISYNDITDAAWSKDGKNIIVSSMEGYCHYLNMDLDKLGTKIQEIPTCPESPHFIKKKTKKEKKLKECPEENIMTPVNLTPTTKTLVVTTPKSTTPGLMLKFLKKSTEESPISSKAAEKKSDEPKAKKRINLISID